MNSKDNSMTIELSLSAEQLAPPRAVSDLSTIQHYQPVLTGR